ncbi:MAG: type II toxin-antitoxin system RelE/ParE family toxin [Oscillospiraceae bacterium]|nr:type II toxin-antitoxin system RelE/ParE family toxin [Oscillospiraceae bacterium]
MKEYKVIISPAAQNDFQDVTDHLDTLSQEAATAYFDSFVEKIKTLKSSPESSPLARDPQLRLRRYRLLPIEKHIVFYVISGSNVEIRRILYARRQYERLV